jgi:DNA polymerase-3 subunit gamma/tau
MEETSLYRKLRPMTFETIIGQDAIVKALKNQVIYKRLNHAYLFFGIRGTGKTTAARILARAINCENPQQGNPCNECPTCKRVLEGSTSLVIEWDAASHGLVDDVRDIEEYIRTKPRDGKYRVFIIDEIQEMKKSATNAFLKTLEEPPEYVIFILATTKLKNIPLTITSRCQRDDFNRIPKDLIISHMKEILESNGVHADDGALRRIAALSEGSMRDALSLLDRVRALDPSKDITLEATLKALSRIDMSIYAECVQNFVDGKASKNVIVFDRALNSGVSEEQFLIDLLWYLKNIYLYKTIGMAEKDAFTEEAFGEVQRLAESITEEKLNLLVNIFEKTRKEVTYSKSRRVLIEVAIIEAGLPNAEERAQDTKERIDKSLMRIESLNQ